MNFIKDTNTWGPFTNGTTKQTGVLFADQPAWRQVQCPITDICFRQPTGLHAPAQIINGVLTVTGAWVE